MAWSRLDLGVGLIAVEGIDLLWPAVEELVDVIEVEPQTLWDHANGDGRRIGRAALDWLRSRRRPLLSHGVGYPVGGTVAPQPGGVRASARSARELDAVQWSEHLSFNRAGAVTEIRHAGYLLPPVPAAETVAAAVGHIARFQDQFDRPFLVETPTSYLRPVDNDLCDGQFVAQIAAQADCGILLDLHNIWANELNGRQPVADFLAEIPLDRVWEVHLAGGHYLNGIYLDAHIGSVPKALLDLARVVIPTLPRLRAILFEAVPESVAELRPDGLATVLTELSALARLPAVTPNPQPSPVGRPSAAAARGDVALGDAARVEVARGDAALVDAAVGDAAEREALLLAYTTRAQDAHPGNDPGADILRHLTDHARLSLLVTEHGPKLRQLLLEYGREYAERLLQQFLGSTPASAWPAEQNAAFAAWWSARAHADGSADAISAPSRPAH